MRANNISFLSTIRGHRLVLWLSWMVLQSMRELSLSCLSLSSCRNFSVGIKESSTIHTFKARSERIISRHTWFHDILIIEFQRKYLETLMVALYHGKKNLYPSHLLWQAPQSFLTLILSRIWQKSSRPFWKTLDKCAECLVESRTLKSFEHGQAPSQADTRS